jgi:hypothetical protein
MVGLGSGPRRVKEQVGDKGIALAEWVGWLSREGWDGDGDGDGDGGRVRLEAARKGQGGDAAPRRSLGLFSCYPPRATLLT